MRRRVLVAVLLLGAGVDTLAQSSVQAAPLVTPFSSAAPGATMPTQWKPLSLGSQKTPTEYRIVDEQGQRALHAKASAAASALIHAARFDIQAAPVVEWRWKVSGLIPEADNAIASKEDSPARIIFVFDGDKSKLSVFERSAGVLAKSVTGREAPYAEIMYVWSNKAPVGTIIPNPHTKRVQMVVAASGPGGVGTWQTLSRNLRDDFRRAYGEEPGLLTDVAVLTDTDNTGATVEAWYGDIKFLPGPP